MSEEVRQRALDPFFTTKGPKSTGLGLSVAHWTLQRRGGKLAIESAEGKGTTVTISLPISPVTAVAQPTPAMPSAPPMRTAEIPVIDDEAKVPECTPGGPAEAAGGVKGVKKPTEGDLNG